MNDTRARFEEIWPVPDGVYWHETAGDYMTLDGIDDWQDHYFQRVRDSYAARLDTFTRCQETTSIHMSLIDELAQSLQWYVDEDEINEGDPENKYWVDGKHEAEALLDSAKQITEQKK